MFCLTEKDDPVAFQKHRLAVRNVRFPAADIGANQTFLGQAEIHQPLADDRSPFLDDDFDGFGLGPFEKRYRYDAAPGKGQDFPG